MAHRFHLAVILLSFSSSVALACSCLESKRSGFLHSPSLPENAKGVLFYLSPVEVEYEPHRPTHLQAPSPGDFAVSDLTTNKPQSIRIVRLDVDQEIPELDSVKAIQDSERVNEIAKSSGLFRLEPLAGFAANHTYSFKYRADRPLLELGSVTVKIGSSVSEMSAAHAIYSPAGSPSIAEVSMTTIHGSCLAPIKASVQKLSFTLPRELAAYSDSILVFHHVRAKGGVFKNWQFKASLCADAPFGHVRDWRVFRSCNVHRPASDYSDEIIDEAYASWGFLELEDHLHKSKTVKLDFSPACS